MKQFFVTADHKVARYTFTRTEVRVGEDAFDHTFHADHPQLGCGKNYRSPQDAILALFQDHACFNIKIEEE
jgi:hypothetical protein